MNPPYRTAALTRAMLEHLRDDSAVHEARMWARQGLMRLEDNDAESAREFCSHALALHNGRSFQDGAS